MWQNATQSQFCAYLSQLPFARLVREIATPIMLEAVRFQATAMSAMHESAEAFLVEIFERSQLVAIHTKRIMVMPKDLHLVFASMTMAQAKSCAVQRRMERLPTSCLAAITEQGPWLKHGLPLASESAYRHIDNGLCLQ
eukprot:jgi/Chlat1/5712/Chrsp38S05526